MMGVGYNPKIVTDGLIGNWDAGNIKSYPGSGSTWTNLIGLTSGTIFNSPTFSSSDGNGSFSFTNAGAHYVNTGVNFDNDFSAGITVQAWIKATSYAAFNRIFSINNAANTDYQYFMQTNVTSGVLQFGTSSTAYTNSLTPVGIGTWVHIAATCNYGASSIKLYLNGNDNTGAATGTPAYTADIGTGYIGRLDSASTGFYGNKTISNVQVYSRALTAAEILQNYTAMRGRFGT